MGANKVVESWVGLDVPPEAVPDVDAVEGERRWLLADGTYVALGAYERDALSEQARLGPELHHGLILGSHAVPDDEVHNVLRTRVEGAVDAIASRGTILSSRGEELELVLIVAHAADGRAAVLAVGWPRSAPEAYFERAVEIGRSLRILERSEAQP